MPTDETTIKQRQQSVAQPTDKQNMLSKRIYIWCFGNMKKNTDKNKMNYDAMEEKWHQQRVTAVKNGIRFHLH